jgi:hypothetical protein
MFWRIFADETASKMTRCGTNVGNEQTKKPSLTALMSWYNDTFAM